MDIVYVSADITDGMFTSAIWLNDSAHDLGDFPYTEQGFIELGQSILQVVPGTALVHIVIKPVGGRESELMHYAYALGWLIIVPDPIEVLSWAESNGYQIDKETAANARMLVHYGMSQRSQSHTSPDKNV